MSTREAGILSKLVTCVPGSQCQEPTRPARGISFPGSGAERPRTASLCEGPPAKTGRLAGPSGACEASDGCFAPGKPGAIAQTFLAGLRVAGTERCGMKFGRRLIISPGWAMMTAEMLREWLRQLFLGVLVFVVVGGLLAFAVDFALFRMRVSGNRNPYGSVWVSHSYAVLQKNGKTEFIFDPPQPESCVHALFPHSGMQPCWYLSRHPERRTNI
jgi:hypothetical protein